jgi:hypothetical protein
MVEIFPTLNFSKRRPARHGDRRGTRSARSPTRTWTLEFEAHLTDLLGKIAAGALATVPEGGNDDCDLPIQ